MNSSSSAGHGAGASPSPDRIRARVLLVDDDGIVLRATAAALRRHDVVALVSANEAIERVARGERFDAVFCDAVMPERSGLEVFAALSTADPELAARFVLLTGGVDERIEAHAAELGLPILEKPFELDDLEAHIGAPRRA